MANSNTTISREELEAELLEQARLLGMSGEREARMLATIAANDRAIKTLQQERDDREKYWRDWNGRAANRAALLEGKIDQLHECCTKRGARMEILWECMNMGYGEFIRRHPEARDWFDEDGVPK